MATNRGLGRGLDALISQKSAFTSGRTVLNLNIETIKANPYQARKHFDPAKISELADSIKEHGVVQPIIVTKNQNAYELVAGERRLRAAKIAGLEMIPAIIKEFNNEQKMAIGLIENIQRQDLNPLEEARAYQSLSKEFKFTQEEIAKKIGKSRSVIANTLRLLSLPLEMQVSIEKGELSASHGRTLASIEDKKQQQKVWQDMLNGNVNVRQAEKTVKEIKTKDFEIKQDLIIENIKQDLTSFLATKVEISGNQDKGSIKINYFSKEDLERIMAKLKQ